MSGHSSQASAQTHQPAITGSSAAVDVVDYLFPRDSADVAAGLTYAQFQRATVERSIASCMHGQGLPGPPSLPPVAPSSDFPDLQQMRAQRALTYAPDSGNLSTARYRSPTAGMSKAEATAYKAAYNSCAGRASRQLRTLGGGAGAAATLESHYMEIYEQVTQSGVVKQAGRQAQRCAARRGFTFAPIHGDYMVGAILTENSDIAQVRQRQGQRAAIASDQKDAAILASCLEPLDRIRGALLSKARAQFFASNALAIRQLQADAQRVVSELLNEQRRTHPAG